MFGQHPIFAYLGLRSILMLCEQIKIGEYGVLAEYLPNLSVNNWEPMGLKKYLVKAPQWFDLLSGFKLGRFNFGRLKNP